MWETSGVTEDERAAILEFINERGLACARAMEQNNSGWAALENGQATGALWVLCLLSGTLPTKEN